MNHYRNELPADSHTEITPELLLNLPPAELQLMTALYQGASLDEYARKAKLPPKLVDRIHASALKRIEYEIARNTSSFRPTLQSEQATLAAFAVQRGSEAHWQNRANCRDKDPELFFPVNENAVRQIRMAKKICEECPVVQQCLQEALTSNPKGIWGGMTENERNSLGQRNAKTAS